MRKKQNNSSFTGNMAMKPTVKGDGMDKTPARPLHTAYNVWQKKNWTANRFMWESKACCSQLASQLKSYPAMSA
jgi:hypothetical protein